MFRNDLNDQLWRDFQRFVRWYDVLKLFDSNLHGNRFAFQIAVSDQFIQCAFQFTNIGFDIDRYIMKDLILDLEAIHLHFLM